MILAYWKRFYYDTGYSKIVKIKIKNKHISGKISKTKKVTNSSVLYI